MGDENIRARWCAARGPGGDNQSKTHEVSYPKSRLRWTPELHEQFVRAVNDLGGPYRATPKTILNLMGGGQGIALYQVKSHLQKFRLGKVSKSTTGRSNTSLPFGYHSMNETRLPFEGLRRSSFSNAFTKSRSPYESIFKTLGNGTHGNRHLLDEAPFKNFQPSGTVSSAQTNQQHALGTSFMNFPVSGTVPKVQTNQQQVPDTSFLNFQAPKTFSSVQPNQQVLGTSSEPIASFGHVINDCTPQWVNELFNGSGEQEQSVLPPQPTIDDNQNASLMFDDSMNYVTNSSSDFSTFINKGPDDQTCMDVGSFFEDAANFTNVDDNSSLNIYDYDIVM
ncbi:hypothetical protein ACJIZ3_010552 [Penstemon smallii]|uniref:Myb-like domain-containing protein n=1 Tax=Penstemon smallii TaxID=265156 RepID=A0ABD3UI63_9LAMI